MTRLNTSPTIIDEWKALATTARQTRRCPLQLVPLGTRRQPAWGNAVNQLWGYIFWRSSPTARPYLTYAQHTPDGRQQKQPGHTLVSCVILIRVRAFPCHVSKRTVISSCCSGHEIFRLIPLIKIQHPRFPISLLMTEIGLISSHFIFFLLLSPISRPALESSPISYLTSSLKLISIYQSRLREDAHVASVS